MESWQNLGGQGEGEKPLNLLDEYYKAPQKHAYIFQSYVFYTRVLQVRTGLTD